MEHSDEDVLALAALGEPVPDADRSHLDRCPRCAAEVAALSRVVTVGRSVTPADALVAPAPAVWDRIRAELDLPGAGSTTSAAAPSAAPSPGPAAAPSAASSAAPSAARSAVPAGDVPAGDVPAGDVAPVVPLRRRRVAPWVAAAAACGVVLGGAGGAWWASRDDVTPPDVVAEAALEPLPGWSSSGDARVEVTADGVRELVVTLRGDGADDGYHEVWLIDRDVTRLVSLGVLTGTEGRFTVPTGLDLDEFPVVDVSDEPLDGDPAHSGDSIIRGVLGA